MRKPVIIKAIRAAQRAAVREISEFSASGGKYAHGLASEGYAAGYRDAMSDALLLLESDTMPNTRFFR